jgi:hypothetical protein
MPSANERENFSGSSNYSQESSGGAGLPTGYIEDAFKIAAIYRTLGGLEKLFDGLGATTKANSDKIEDLTQRVYAISYIKKDIAQNTRGLNHLEKRHNKDVKELEKKVNGLGIRLDSRINDLKINDIGKLNNIAHTTESFGRLALACFSGGVIGTILVEVFRFLITGKL